MKRLVAVLGCAIVISGCSTRREACTEAGALTGAMMIGGGMAGGFIGTECGPRCVEWKIAHGESIHEAVSHHVNRTNDLILFGALPGAAVGAIGGGLIGFFYCSDEGDPSLETEVSNLFSAN